MSKRPAADSIGYAVKRDSRTPQNPRSFCSGRNLRDHWTSIQAPNQIIEDALENTFQARPVPALPVGEIVKPAVEHR